MNLNRFGSAAILISGVGLGAVSWLVGDAAAGLAEAGHTDVARIRTQAHYTFWFFTKNLYDGYLNQVHSLDPNSQNYLTDLRRAVARACLHLASRSPSAGAVLLENAAQVGMTPDQVRKLLPYLSSSGKVKLSVFDRIALWFTEVVV